MWDFIMTVSNKLLTALFLSGLSLLLLLLGVIASNKTSTVASNEANAAQAKATPAVAGSLQGPKVASQVAPFPSVTPTVAQWRVYISARDKVLVENNDLKKESQELAAEEKSFNDHLNLAIVRVDLRFDFLKEVFGFILRRVEVGRFQPLLMDLSVALYFAVVGACLRHVEVGQHLLERLTRVFLAHDFDLVGLNGILTSQKRARYLVVSPLKLPV
jgi:hypothetical protein